MVQEAYDWGEYYSGIGIGFPIEIGTGSSTRIEFIPVFISTDKDTSELCEYRTLPQIESKPEIHMLRTHEEVCREIGGTMLVIIGAIKLYYVAGFTDIRYGKHA
jgi:hypothetical protein